MRNYSIKEMQALVTRAAKGSYLPWGLAEEAAASVGWLEQHGVSALRTLVDLLSFNDGADPADLIPALGAGPAQSRKPVCPVITGAYLSDLRGTNLSDDPLGIGSVRAPILMVPFLVWVAQDRGRSLLTQWGRVRVHVCGDGVEIASGTEDASVSGCQDVVISFAPGRPRLTGPTVERVEVADRDRLVLEQLTLRTQLPESEQSKASGAGGDRVDDD